MNFCITLAALEFASPAMLGWLAAAALPWLVNLWMRRRHVETPWAAVDLLIAAVRERSRRLRLREMLLLVMRTAILLLVALAAAQPLWRTTSGAIAADERMHQVIVIDQSFSMACRDQGASRFERAQQRARQIIDDAAAGDAFTLIAWAEISDNVLGRPTFDAAAARSALDSLEPVDTIADLPAALRAVEQALQTARREFPDVARSRVTFISDLAQNTWEPALPKAAGASGGAGQRGEIAEAWAALAPHCEIMLESVDDGIRDNVAITELAIVPQLPTLDAPVALTVQLRTFGGSSLQSMAVELLLDGRHVGRQDASVEPGDSTVVRFETRILEPGSHVFEARLADDFDALSIDNRRWLSTEVRRGLKATCFADLPHAAEDVARALNPRLRESGVGGIAIDVLATSSLANSDLTASDAVFVCNVAELSPREQRLLRRYVEGGGAAVFILGNRIHPAAYNEFFAKQSSDGPADADALLPVKLADRPVDGNWRLDPLEYRHPILAPFAGRSRSGLLGVRVARYYPLQVADGDRSAAVAMAFTSGDPALVVGDFGAGRVAILATDPSLAAGDEPWSTLAVSPSFVPLVRELFEHVAVRGRSERLNGLAGEVLASPPGAGPSDAVGRWQSPDGDITSTPPTTRRRGVYRFLGTTVRSNSSHAREAGEVAAATGHVTSIAVNIDPRESDLAVVDAGEWISPSAPTAPQSTAIPNYAGATPLQRHLLAAAAALVLAELAAAWLLGRGWA